MTYLDFPPYRIRANERAWILNRVTVSKSGATEGQELETFVGNFCTKEGLCKALPERIAREALASGEFAMMDALSAQMLKACEHIDQQRVKGRV